MNLTQPFIEHTHSHTSHLTQLGDCAFNYSSRFARAMDVCSSTFIYLKQYAALCQWQALSTAIAGRIDLLVLKIFRLELVQWLSPCFLDRPHTSSQKQQLHNVISLTVNQHKVDLDVFCVKTEVILAGLLTPIYWPKYNFFCHVQRSIPNSSRQGAKISIRQFFGIYLVVRHVNCDIPQFLLGMPPAPPCNLQDMPYFSPQ